MKKITTTALVAILLATSAPAHAGFFSNLGNWSVRAFHKVTGSKPTAYDKTYNSAYNGNATRNDSRGARTQAQQQKWDK